MHIYIDFYTLNANTHVCISTPYHEFDDLLNWLYGACLYFLRLIYVAGYH